VFLHNVSENWVMTFLKCRHVSDKVVRNGLERMDMQTHASEISDAARYLSLVESRLEREQSFTLHVHVPTCRYSIF